jgi:molecular chaperone GrpE
MEILSVVPGKKRNPQNRCCTRHGVISDKSSVLWSDKVKGRGMQQNGQEQQERGHLHQTAEQLGREGAPNPALVSVQVEQQLTTEHQRAEECLDLLRRTQADFINYRRRMGQEQVEGRIAAQSALLFELLPVLDDLERALGAAPPEQAQDSWVQGLLLVARRLTTLLDRLGVRKIGKPGEPFDPHKHEAITTEVRTDAPEGTVLRIIRPGYALGERSIRPAQVSVARTPSSMSDASEQQEDV